MVAIDLYFDKKLKGTVARVMKGQLMLEMPQSKKTLRRKKGCD